VHYVVVEYNILTTIATVHIVSLILYNAVGLLDAPGGIIC